MTLTVLLALDTVLTVFLWNPLGRSDLRFVFVFLAALLLDRGKASPFFLALLGFSFGTIGKGDLTSPTERFLWGFSLVLGTALFKSLLEGLRERLKLSHLPKAMEGAPLLFWLAGLLFLAFWGFHKVGPNL